MCTYFFLDSNWRGGGSIGQCPASSPSLFFNVHIFVWERFPMCHSLHCHISTLRRLHHVGDHCLFHIIGSRRSCQCRLVLLSYSASISRQSENQTFFFARLWMEPKIGIFWLRVHMCLCHWSLNENHWLWGHFAPRVLLTGIVERHGHARRLLRHQLLHHGHAVRLPYDQIYASL